jgi:hypothetical protein
MLDEYAGMRETFVQAEAVKTFGDIPLIVLTAKLNTTPKDWQEWQMELLQLSSNSQQLFAEHSGHNVQLEQAEAAVAAILQMVQQIRETANKRLFPIKWHYLIHLPAGYAVHEAVSERQRIWTKRLNLTRLFAS